MKANHVVPKKGLGRKAEACLRSSGNCCGRKPDLCDVKLTADAGQINKQTRPCPALSERDSKEQMCAARLRLVHIGKISSPISFAVSTTI